MNGFTSVREACDFLSDCPKPGTDSLRKIRIDSKGRVSIPSDIRKSLGMNTGSEILLGFNLREKLIVLYMDGENYENR